MHGAAPGQQQLPGHPRHDDSSADSSDVDSNGDSKENVDYIFTEEVLKGRVSALELWYYMPIHALLFTFFCVYIAVFTPNIADSFSLTNALLLPFVNTPISSVKDAIYFADIKDAAMFSRYLENVVAPLLVDLRLRIGPAVALGAMRVRTQRVRPYTCTLNKVVPTGAATAAEACYGPYSASTASTSVDEDEMLSWFSLFSSIGPFDHKTCAELSTDASGTKVTVPSIQMTLSSYDCGGFFFDIPLWRPNHIPIDDGDINNTINITGDSSGYGVHDYPYAPIPYGNTLYSRLSLSKVRELLLPLLKESSSSFFDNKATRFAAAEIVFYSPALHIFTHVALVAEVGSGGAWSTKATANHFELWTPDGAAQRTVVAVFLFCVAVPLFALALARRLVIEFHYGAGAAQTGLAPADFSEEEGKNATAAVGQGGRSQSSSSSLGSFAGVVAGIKRIIKTVATPWNMMDATLLVLLVISSAYAASHAAVSRATLRSISIMMGKNRNMGTIDISWLAFRQEFPVTLLAAQHHSNTRSALHACAAVLLFAGTTRFLALFAGSRSSFQRLRDALSSAWPVLWSTTGLLLLMLMVTFAIAAFALFPPSAVGEFETIGAAFKALLTRILLSMPASQGWWQQQSATPTRLEAAILLWVFSFCVIILGSVCVAVLSTTIRFPSSLVNSHKRQEGNRLRGGSSGASAIVPATWEEEVKSSAYTQHRAPTLKWLIAHTRRTVCQHPRAWLASLKMCWLLLDDAAVLHRTCHALRGYHRVKLLSKCKSDNVGRCCCCSGGGTARCSCDAEDSLSERDWLTVARVVSASSLRKGRDVHHLLCHVMWHEIRNEWRAYHLSPEMRAARRRAALLACGVESVIGRHTVLFSGFAERLTELERNAGRVAMLLAEAGQLAETAQSPSSFPLGADHVMK